MPAYRDPLSGKTYCGERALEEAVARNHAGQLDRLGVTAAQLIYNSRNRLPLATREGRSVLSGRPTRWCERAGRYERFADDAERQQYRQVFLERMQRVHGKEHLLGDPEHQRAMLASRSISGTYEFRDGTRRTYTGKYELDLLEFMDLGLGWPGEDVQTPAPQNFPYRDAEGRDRWYIPDAWVESLNLIVEVKSADNCGYRLRDIDVERCKDAVLATSGYNFVKVLDKDYGDLVDEIARLKRQAEDGDEGPGAAPAPLRESRDLADYSARRDFSATPEPSPEQAARMGPGRFVVQEHRADRAGLHWDLRLELGRALLSWAVPRGVPELPGGKRLAVRTEDHPLAYGGFEGTIPPGQYGSGTVRIWDSGTWTPRGDPKEELEKGALKFDLDGERLKGGYALIRLKPRAGERQESWLVVKELDRPGLRESALPAPPAMTNPGREIWPGVTKADLAAYWERVAPAALPEIAGRPLSVFRCPDGVAAGGFFQKHLRSLRGPILDGEAGGQPYVLVRGAEGLAALAQASAVELHGWGCTSSDPAHPDRLVLDLDPEEGARFPQVAKAALELRRRLLALGLEPFCRTTGSGGLHVVCPLRPGARWERARAVAREIALDMSSARPDLYSASSARAPGRGRVLVDWMRNSLGATAACSFSPRALPGAPVAARLAWADVGPSLDPSAFTVPAASRPSPFWRPDPWEGFEAAAADLPAADPRSTERPK